MERKKKKRLQIGNKMSVRPGNVQLGKNSDFILFFFINRQDG